MRGQLRSDRKSGALPASAVAITRVYGFQKVGENRVDIDKELGMGNGIVVMRDAGCGMPAVGAR